MNRRKIKENDKRRLIAESMGKCMNPDCKSDLFFADGDIIENAHIIPYRNTKDNTFDNLIILCPNCHTNFDKNKAFTEKQMEEWKEIRKEELEKSFSKNYKTFNELHNHIVPFFIENKSLFENYYVNDKKLLWDKFEPIILVNNRKIKNILENNIKLFQSSEKKSQSNQHYVYELIAHIEEFEHTRNDKEKLRHILFPDKVSSIFGIEPSFENIIPMTESLEKLMTQLELKEISLSDLMRCVSIAKKYNSPWGAGKY